MIPLLLVAVLSLTGCVSAREVPPPITDAALQAYLEKRLDAAWLNTGLGATVERPLPDPTTLVDRFRDVNQPQDFSDCTVEAGVGSWSSTERDGGPQLLDQTGGPLESPEKQLQWYSCFAQFPSSEGFGSMLLTRAELDYLYDYYRDWVVPCIALKGYSIAEMPTRDQFVEESFYAWVPYYNVIPAQGQIESNGLSLEKIYELADQCGDPFPGMDYGTRLGF